MVYGTPVTSEEDLIARVHGAIKNLKRQLHLLGRVCVKLNAADVGGSAMTYEIHSLNPVLYVDRSMCCTCKFIDDMWNRYFDSLQRPNRAVPS